MKKRVGVGNNKGGVGKTTTLVELVANSVRRKKKTLVLDLDPQCGAGQMLLGAVPEMDEITLFHVLIGNAGVKDALRKASSNWPGVYVLCSNQKLENAHKFLETEPGWETCLDEIIESIEDNFDEIYVDMPPATGFLTKIALRAINTLVIPTDISIYAASGLNKMFALIDHFERKSNHKIDLVRVIVTASQKGGSKVIRSALDELKEKYGDQYLPVDLPHTVRVWEAQREIPPRAASQVLEENHKLLQGYKSLYEAII